MTPIRSSSLLGLRGMRLGVEWPEPGGEPPNEEPAHSDGGMELIERKRPPRLSPLPTRHSISSARMAVLSFSSWIILHRWRTEKRDDETRFTHYSLTFLMKRDLVCLFWYLISLLMASSCSCSIKARVCASAWPPGDSRSTELKMVSRSSSRSEASMSLSKAWATFASTLACCMRSHSCSFNVCTWIKPHRYKTGNRDKDTKRIQTGKEGVESRKRI